MRASASANHHAAGRQTRDEAEKGANPRRDSCGSLRGHAVQSSGSFDSEETEHCSRSNPVSDGDKSRSL